MWQPYLQSCGLQSPAWWCIGSWPLLGPLLLRLPVCDHWQHRLDLPWQEASELRHTALLRRELSGQSGNLACDPFMQQPAQLALLILRVLHQQERLAQPNLQVAHQLLAAFGIILVGLLLALHTLGWIQQEQRLFGTQPCELRQQDRQLENLQAVYDLQPRDLQLCDR